MPKSKPSSDICFNQSCPVCGRRLLIRLRLLGRRVYCQHCGGGFTALDESCAGGPRGGDRVEDLLARASRALAEAAVYDGDASGVSG